MFQCVFNFCDYNLKNIDLNKIVLVGLKYIFN